MYIPLIALKFLVLLGTGCLLGMVLILVLFAPEAYRFARSEMAGRFPFDKPVWWYRMKKKSAKARLWLENRGADASSLLMLVLVFALLWLGLVITNPL
jgi:hypothetical protein